MCLFSPHKPGSSAAEHKLSKRFTEGVIMMARVNIPRLMASYYTEHPDPDDSTHSVSFGTSGHRGSSFKRNFNEDHIAAISQAISEYRNECGINGPLFIGMDTHALSEAALRTSVEVFAANGVEVRIQEGFDYTPTPVISHAILSWNCKAGAAEADGVVITPSHNPPEDGGFKYNPPSGGPAGVDVTSAIQNRANELLSGKLNGVRRMDFRRALSRACVRFTDYIAPYVDGLGAVLDMDAIRDSGVKIGADPLGGSGVHFWDHIIDRYRLNIDVVNRDVDPTFSFMPPDHDGKIRMDCSSPYAMAKLVALKDRYDISFGNDPDYDRHGIVTKSGLMQPNAYLAVAVRYLFTHRNSWNGKAMVGKTVVSSSIIDRVAVSLGRRLFEVPVGFKWFVEGLLSGTLGFGGEESAGATYVKKNGTAWTTDKDGFVMSLLAAEILAVTGKDPSENYSDIVYEFGMPFYSRKDTPATAEEKKRLKNLTPSDISSVTLAGEPIEEKLTRAPGNGAPIEGLKVIAKSGWFAARPSGTEDMYKIYAESFKGEEHLRAINEEAEMIVSKAIRR